MNTTRAQLRGALPYVLGLGAYLCTMIMANGPLGGTFDVAVLHPRLVQAGRIAACVATACTVLLGRRVPDLRRLAGFAAVLVAVPMVCSYAPAPAESVVAHAGQTWLPAAAAVVEGAGGALVALLFLAMLAARSAAVAVIAVPASMAVSHLLYMALGLLSAPLSPWARPIAMMLAIVLLAVCVWRPARADVASPMPSASDQTVGQDSSAIIPRLRELFSPAASSNADPGLEAPGNVRSSLLVLTGAVLMPFVYVLVCSMVLETKAGTGAYWAAVEWFVVAVLVLVALVALRFGESDGLDAAVLALNAVFATAMLVVSVFGEDFAGSTAALLQGGFFLYNAPIWMFAARCAQGSLGRGLALYGCVNAVLHFSALMGAVAGDAVASLAQPTMLLLSRVAFVGVWLAAMALLVLFLLNRRRDEGRGPQDADEAANSFELGCAELARTAGLSEREAQVMAAYARGRSASYIAGELVVSEETVKTHIKHIYAKAGVHSRQELLDRIDGK